MRALILAGDIALRRRVAESLPHSCREVTGQGRWRKQGLNGAYDLLVLADPSLLILIKLCRQVRKQVENQQTFLLALCPTDVPAAQRRLLQAGADDVATMGMDTEHLTLRLECAVQQALKRNLYDPLTRLPNRQLLLEMLKRTLAASRRRGAAPFAVLFLDLDYFKKVNDTFGHAAGDRVLVEVAQRLQSAVRCGDMAARVGGDEFVVLMPHLRDIGDIERIVERLHKGLVRPIRIGGRKITPAISIGWATSGLKLKRGEEYLHHADRMMYRQKYAAR